MKMSSAPAYGEGMFGAVELALQGRRRRNWTHRRFVIKLSGAADASQGGLLPKSQAHSKCSLSPFNP